MAIWSSLLYVDAPAASHFMCAVFGFERQSLCHQKTDPTVIEHSQLR